MNRRILQLILAASMFWAGSALAGQQTVTLAVDNLTCVTCPIIVEKALQKVPGVEDANVDFEKKTATVIFDDERVSIKDLTEATRQVGFPSRLPKDEDEDQARAAPESDSRTGSTLC